MPALSPSQHHGDNGLPLSKFERAIAEFASVDHTAAVALRLFYFNDTFAPYVSIGEYSDRSHVLETSWELASQKAVERQGCSSGGEPALAESFLSLWIRRTTMAWRWSNPGQVSRISC